MRYVKVTFCIVEWMVRISYFCSPAKLVVVHWLLASWLQDVTGETLETCRASPATSGPGRMEHSHWSRSSRYSVLIG